MTNASLGKRNENYVKNVIRNNSELILPKLIEKYPEIITPDANIVSVSRVGTEQEKSDIFIRFSGDRVLSASIKSFRAAGFNQVVRKKIDQFCEDVELDSRIRNKLVERTILKARASRDLSQQWIDEAAGRIVLPAIEQKLERILHYSFCGNDDPHLLIVICNDGSRVIVVYDMRGFLKEMISRHDVKLTNRGVISLNEFLSIQRKGGNGVHVKKISKDNIKHPGNNVQVKLRCKKLIDSDVEPLLRVEPQLTGSLLVT